MGVKIIIKRNVPADKQEELRPLLVQLRALATTQPGYISGVTLRHMDRPNEYLVISTWQSREDWDRWTQNKQRQEVQDTIDTLLGEESDYDVYLYG